MPKQKITREAVVDAAFALVRSGGTERLTVKRIAERIGCSVQPIYSYCHNMEGLRQAVAEKVCAFMREYLAAHVDRQDLFRSTGRAYLRLAEEEPHLFKFFILRQRTGISSLDDLYRMETDSQIAAYISEELGMSLVTAKQLHLQMLLYTLGLGTVFAVATPGIGIDEIYRQQEIAYQAFLNQAIQKENAVYCEK